jgi:hypothetical protein
MGKLVSVGWRFSAGHTYIGGLDMSCLSASQDPGHLAQGEGIKHKDGAADAGWRSTPFL